jgi:hypothetical protein
MVLNSDQILSVVYLSCMALVIIGVCLCGYKEINTSDVES